MVDPRPPRIPAPVDGGTDPSAISVRQIRRRVKAGVLWSTLEAFGVKFAAFFLFLVMARLLSPEAFGLMAAAGVVMAVADYLTEQGLGASVVQRQDLDAAHTDTAFWVQLGLSLMFAGAGFAAAPWLAEAYSRPELTPIIRVLLLGTPLGALSSMQQALLQRQLAFKMLAKRRLLATVIGGLAGVSLAIAGAGVWSLVGQLLLGQMASVVLLWSSSGWRPGWRIRWWALRDLSRFSIGMFLLVGTGIVKVRADHFIIGVYLGPVALGLYTTANKVVTAAAGLFVAPFSRMNFSMFSRLNASPDAQCRAYFVALFAALAFGLPTAVGTLVIGGDLAVALLGPQWTSVGPVLGVMGLALITRSIAAADGGVILAHGRLLLRSGISATHVLCTICAVWWIVDRGIVAVATLNITASLAMLPVNYWVVRQTLRFDPRTYFQTVWPPIVSSLLMAAAMLAVKSSLLATLPHAAALIATGATGVLTYAIALWWLSPTSRRLASEMSASLMAYAKAALGYS